MKSILEYSLKKINQASNVQFPLLYSEWPFEKKFAVALAVGSVMLYCARILTAHYELSLDHDIVMVSVTKTPDFKNKKRSLLTILSDFWVVGRVSGNSIDIGFIAGETNIM